MNVREYERRDEHGLLAGAHGVPGFVDIAPTVPNNFFGSARPDTGIV